MKTTRTLLTAALLAGSFMANAQFTPFTLINLPVDYPGLINNYTLITVDANTASTGAPNWTMVETIDVNRNSSNMITATEVHTTFPLPIHRSTATKTGNVYTSMVDLYTSGTWAPYQREIIYSDGVNDTASTVENYNSGTSSYVNADRYTMAYTAGRITGISHYTWTAGAWQPDTRREITYSGTQYATDTTYKMVGTAWDLYRYNSHYYVAGILDSSVWYEKVGASMAIKEIYTYDANTASQLNVIYNYSESSSVWKLSTRTTFSGATVGIQPNRTSLPYAVQVYPVPASDYVTVAVTGDISHNTRATVTDMAGRRVMEIPITNDKTQLSLAALSPGSYIVAVEAAGRIVHASTIAITR